MAAAEPTRTTLRSRGLTPTDRDQAKAEAQAQVAVDLADVIEPADVLRRVRAWQDEVERLRVERDRAALSLALYEGVRSLNRVIGNNRTRWYQMRQDALQLTEAERAEGWLLRATPEEVAERAKRAKVRRVRNAEKVLQQVAGPYVLAEERVEAARPYRDESILALAEAGWLRAQIADLIGVNESRISQIVSEHQAKGGRR